MTDDMNLDYKQIDHLVEPVLRKMEQCGVELDVKYLKRLDVEFAKQLSTLESAIYKLVGHQFNLDSPRQLAQIIYGELQLASGDVILKKTKTHLSTSASELAKLIHSHPVIPLLLDYREKNKLKNTYLEPLPKLVDENDRVHTTYAIDTASGRLSSKNPNLQNIPIRSEDGRKIRRAFVAQSGYRMLSVDYSQIQLRIAAHFSADEALITAFRSGQDIHATTAKIMGVDRRIAKTINFGLLFGQSAHGLAQSLQITRPAAQSFIDRYFSSFPRLSLWMKQIQQQAYDLGYVETLFGRKRWLGELKGPSNYLRQFAERVAINHPIQGTEADIIKIAMAKIDQEIDIKEALMIMQVHDELVFEIPQSVDLGLVCNKIQTIMNQAVKLMVGLETQTKLGKNWADMEKLSMRSKDVK